MAKERSGRYGPPSRRRCASVATCMLVWNTRMGFGRRQRVSKTRRHSSRSSACSASEAERSSPLAVSPNPNGGWTFEGEGRFLQQDLQKLTFELKNHEVGGHVLASNPRSTRVGPLAPRSL